jgi:outer membrane protein insertion porin family
VAIADIGFAGNDNFSDRQLRGVLDTKREGFFWFRSGTFDEERLRADLRGALPQFYASNGFLDFAVVGDSLDVDDETGKARLIIQLPRARSTGWRSSTSGARAASRRTTCAATSRSAGPACWAVSGWAARGIAVRSRAKSSTPWRSRKRPSDIRQLYNNQGYLYAQIIPVVERIPAEPGGTPQVRATWEIEEGNPASIRRVEVAGNTFTHESVIRNQIMVLPGDVYSEEMLIASYRRISGMGFFETPMPMPRIDPDPETGDVDITFEVEEKQTGSVGFGTSLGGAMGLMGFLSYDQPNLFGQAKSGHLRWEFGRYSNNFELSYSDPSIAGSWLSGAVSLFSSRDRFYTFQEGQRRRTGASTRIGIPLPNDRFSRFNVGYSLSRTSYEQFDQSEAETLFSLPPGVQSTLSLGLTRMALDHPVFPTIGTRMELDASLSGGLLGGDGDFQKYSVNGAWWVPVGSVGGGQPGSRPIRFALGLTMEAGALFGDASRFPFERFWMGGVQFGRPLRGYDETTVTPTGYIPRGAQGVALDSRFGDAYMRLSAEYAVRFTDNISIGAFYDAGNIWRGPSEMNPTRLARGAGLGLMLVTPFGPLGLDYAYGFDKDQPGWQLHFKFGGM